MPILLANACALVLGAAMTLDSSPARAQYRYLYPSYYPPPHRIKHKAAVHKHGERQQVSKLPFGDIPKGPLEIFVSIDQQRLHFYSNGVLVATEPVATGVPGHLTPLGVFSVIERDRYHHSNLYSNAPMPFMERITWSGVALHEGPGVGHQASHGCIRMPHDFAAKLWMLPTMGMRVIIARPELRPIPFADSHLFVRKELPPTAALRHGVETAQQVPPGTKSDVQPSVTAPGGAAGNKSVPAAANAGQSPQLDLRLNPAPAVELKPSWAAADRPAVKDAAASAKPASADPGKMAQTPAPTSPAGQATSAPAEPAKSPAADGKTEPVSSPPTPAATAATPPPAPAAPSKDGPAAASAPSAPPASASPVPGVAIAPAPADMTAPIAIDNVPIPLTKPARIADGSDKPIAIFISRKTNRIYVRQNFAPLFDAPVTIGHPEQPLGTHVFTALDYLPDHSTFRWTATTVPTGTAMRKVERVKYVRDPWGRRRRVRVEERVAEPVSSQPASTPQEALARVQIPQDVIDQISQLMVPGSSLVVSDQGLGSETGIHTDFIVVTR